MRVSFLENENKNEKKIAVLIDADNVSDKYIQYIFEIIGRKLKNFVNIIKSHPVLDFADIADRKNSMHMMQ